MTRYIDKALVAVYLVLAALPVFAMVSGIKGRTIQGVVEAAPAPRLSLDAVLAETYQHDLTSWFEGNLGLKGTSVALDNALLYRVFDETKPGAAVRIGDEGVLFNDEDVNYYNKVGDALPTEQHVQRVADHIAGLQRRLAARGRAFVPLIIPAKSTIWRDKVPSDWVINHREPRPSDVRVYLAFRAAFDARGVRYVDARQILTASAYQRELVWNRDARHWSALGACLAMQGVHDLASQLRGSTPTPYDCHAVAAFARTNTHTDYDLWRVMNAWGVPVRNRVVATVLHSPPIEERASASFIGTSFCWEILRDADESGRFRDLDMAYYNKTLVSWPENVHTKLETGTDAWRDALADKDIYVLDLFESYLGVPDSYVDEFLRDLAAHLDDVTPAR